MTVCGVNGFISRSEMPCVSRKARSFILHYIYLPIGISLNVQQRCCPGLSRYIFEVFTQQNILFKLTTSIYHPASQNGLLRKKVVPKWHSGKTCPSKKRRSNFSCSINCLQSFHGGTVCGLETRVGMPG